MSTTVASDDAASRRPSEKARGYVVTQLALPSGESVVRNIPVEDLDSLGIHHPNGNRNARIEAGRVKNGEEGSREYIVVQGEIEEVKIHRGARSGFDREQVMLVKDFILEDHGAAPWRVVDVPSPAAGVIGRIAVAEGAVDITDQEGSVIARVRHLGPIAVKTGDTIAYGESLGTQNKIGLGPKGRKHVHIEMDIRYEEDFDNYIRDLVDGRLPVQAEHRVGVKPREREIDASLHVSESGERVADVQRALAIESPSRPGSPPRAEPDGFYRSTLQPEVIRFQRRHGLEETGDIDWPTWRRAVEIIHAVPRVPPSVIDGQSAAPYLTPYDAMHDRIRLELHKLASQVPPVVEAAHCESVVHALVAAAADHGMDRYDHLVVGEDRRATGQGRNIFLVRGGLDDFMRDYVCADATRGEPLSLAMERSQDSVARALARQADNGMAEPARLQEQSRAQEQPSHDRAPAMTRP